MYLKKLLKQIRENKDALVEQGVEVGSELIFDGIAGQVAPGIVAVRMAYKQKQMENRVHKALELIDNRMDTILDLLAHLNDYEYRFVEEKVFPIVFENIINEDEEEKIKYIINSFETIIENKIVDEELVLSYLDVIKSLRIIDIQHLYRQTSDYRKKLSMEKRTLEPPDLSEIGQQRVALTKYIHNKLQQLGLIDIDVPVIPEEGPVTKFGYNLIDYIKEKGKASI
ncbi:hypothetical protein ACIP97_13910 [Peribacillus frigoritolerans]|uniref:hypothetical protein n=1 Tax=Peribacillus frigoritolerans TaxID=450367 RepID=UPI003813279C